jgi:DNA-binding transcriptional ArsR family regulator
LKGTRAREIEEKLAVSTSPLRTRIVFQLILRPASAAELAETLSAPIEKVRYQLKRLDRAGFVSTLRERRRRGTMERVYRVESRKLIWDSEEAALVPLAKFKDYEAAMALMIFRGALSANRSRAFQEKRTYLIVRIPIRVDTQGTAEVSKIFEVLVDRLIELRDESLRRLEDESGEPRTASSALLFFRMPTGTSTA